MRDELNKALETSIFDFNAESNINFQHHLLSNDEEKMITILRENLLNCDEFIFSVAFITLGGLTLFLEELKKLEEKNISGKILTGDYLSFTEPKALKKLLSYKNIKVKIYNNSKESFHTKAYLFQKEKYHTCIIGSSNISQSALYSAEEWNIKITDNDFFNVYTKSMSQFEKLWNSNNAVNLSEDFINKYELESFIYKIDSKNSAIFLYIKSNEEIFNTIFRFSKIFIQDKLNKLFIESKKSSANYYLNDDLIF